MSHWIFGYDDWNPGQQPLREALHTLGNGRFATRGAAEEARAGGPHYPGTYLAGGYDRLVSEVAGREVENEDLVNMPNWLPLSFRPEGGEWLDLDRVEVLSYRQELDLRDGVLIRRFRFRDRQGRTWRIRSRRLVHMGDSHLAALEWELTCEDWSGPVDLRAAIDGSVRNAGVARYRDLRGDHLVPVHEGWDGDTSWLVVRTRTSRLHVAIASRLRVDADVHAQRHGVEQHGEVVHHLRVRVGAGRPLHVEKVVAIYSSRDRAIHEPLSAARRAVRAVRDVHTLCEPHQEAWERLWRRCGIEIDGGGESTRLLRLHIFHLLQTVSFHTVDLDVGVPARGLHGEAYRGHIFWDELFIFPYLDLHLPEITRALLRYRHRRLPAARRNAREAGHEGAMFPWQSGSDGREESQVVHLNPRSGRWLPDDTHLQRHIAAAVAYNVWSHHQATEDIEFLSGYGAEVVLDVAKFWASAAAFDDELGRWRIRGVVGPDEYHTRLPGADRPGLDDNAYTNVMAAWCLRTARKVLDLVTDDRRDELLDLLDLTPDDLARWDRIAAGMRVIIGADGIIRQFDGWDDLEELDWDRYRAAHGEVMRLDRILEAEGDRVDRYKVTKQPDVLMLFYLFSSDELTTLLGSMGYRFDPAWIPKNIDYYERRSSHGSTLSQVVHAWLLARADRARSWDLFEQALRADVDDVQGGTTPEGIHLGAMAGTVDLVQRAWLGVRVVDDVLWLHPRLPDAIDAVRLTLRYRGHALSVEVNHEALRISFRQGWSRCVSIGFDGDVYRFERGEERVFALSNVTA